MFKGARALTRVPNWRKEVPPENLQVRVIRSAAMQTWALALRTRCTDQEESALIDLQLDAVQHAILDIRRRY